MTKWNWTPSPDKTVMIDLETQSTQNLKVVGSRAYLRHDSTRLLCLVAKHGKQCLVWAPEGRYPGRDLPIKPGECWPDGLPRDGTGIQLCTDAKPPARLLEWIKAGYTFAAHNAVFDSEAWERLVPAPSPAAWYDTLPVCRASGLPASLDALGNIFLGTGKDELGAKVLKLFYTAKVKGGEVVYPIGTVPAWKLLLRYNVKDVLLLDRVFSATLGQGEPALLDVHSAINSRGIHFDLSFLSRLQNLWVEAETAAVAEIEQLTGGELNAGNLRSVPKVQAWLHKQGVHLVDQNGKPTLNRQQMERFYDNPEEFLTNGDDGESDLERAAFVCEVLKLRQTVTRISRAKLQRICEIADADNRLRDVLVVYGAHTGRFSSRGIQLHNMARGLSDLNVEELLSKHASGQLPLSDVRAAAARCKGNPRVDDVLSTVLRPVFDAEPGKKLAIADYAAIEGRGVAWVAGEQGLLEQFRTGADIYCTMASRIFGRPITKADKDQRQVGKVTVLGCGYSMSAPKFAAYCRASRIDLAAAGTSPEACVDAYRDAHQAIAGVPNGRFRRGGIWHKYQNAVRQAVEKNRPGSVGKCDFYLREGHLVIRLPSGRELTYRNAAVEEVVPPYAVLLGLPLEPKPTVMYDHHHGYRTSLYGGLITENIVQAICRDLLASALVRCERAGLPVVLHVHDEIVAELADADVKEGVVKLCEIMSDPPAWADGFPISVEGFSCPRYTKSPFRGGWVVEAANGEVRKLKVKE